MFLNESEYLLHEGVAGKTVIEAVDLFISGRSREDVMDAELVARHAEHQSADVEPVLAGLAAEGALSTQRMVRCPIETCRTFTPASRVEASRADGDEEPCDGPCGQDLAARDDLEVVQTYKLVSQPVQ